MKINWEKNKNRDKLNSRANYKGDRTRYNNWIRRKFS